MKTRASVNLVVAVLAVVNFATPGSAQQTTPTPEPASKSDGPHQPRRGGVRQAVTVVVRGHDSKPANDRFYTQFRTVLGIQIKAAAHVKPAAIDEADQRLRRLLACAPNLAKKLADADTTIVIVGRDDEITAVPENEQLKGIRDEDGDSLDGIRGLTRNNMVFVGEENLICSPSDPHRGRCTFAHELAHAVENVALDEDAVDQLQAIYWSAFVADRWGGTYAHKDAAEYFAELTCAYFGVARHSAAAGINGAIQLRLHDRDGYEFVHAVFSDRYPYGQTAEGATDGRSRREGRTPNRVSVIDQIIEALRKAGEQAGVAEEATGRPNAERRPGADGASSPKFPAPVPPVRITR